MLKLFYAHTPWVSVLCACLHILWLALTPHLARQLLVVARADQINRTKCRTKCLTTDGTCVAVS